jgi:hypothetical protein
VVGPPYHTAARLVVAAANDWALFDGDHAGRGVDPLRLPFARFLNLIYAWYMERVEDKERFKYELEKPIPGMMVSDRLIADELDAVDALIGGGF